MVAAAELSEPTFSESEMVQGSAPEMTPDLREIIDGVQSVLPDVEWAQLSVSWPADDDGTWFSRRQG
jgi:hypothetical protein